MKKWSILLAFIYFFVSCTPEDQKVPEGILSIDSMKIIVWDLTQAGSYGTTLSEKDTTKKEKENILFGEVLQLHKISKPDFFKSFNFYQAHPLLNQILFDSVNAYAERQRSEMYKKMR